VYSVKLPSDTLSSLLFQPVSPSDITPTTHILTTLYRSSFSLLKVLSICSND
jgi:hypothetical protein